MKGLCLFLTFTAVICNAFCQCLLNDYIFTQSVGTYTEITEGISLGSTSTNDQCFVNPAVPLGGTETRGIGFPIGFNFTFGELVFDRLAIDANGWISLGQYATSPSVNISSTNSYAPIGSIASIVGLDYLVTRIVAFGADIRARSGSSLRIQTVGSAPNRELVVQWKNYMKSSSTTDNLNFQIRLLESSNQIKFIYGTMANNTTSTTVQVGLRGEPSTQATNYINRCTATSWSETTAGLTNTANCIFSNTVYPVSGTTFTWQHYIAIQPRDVNFTTVQLGSISDYQTLNIMNTTLTDSLIIYNISDLMGENPSDFTLINTNLTNITLDNLEEITVTVRFNPQSNGIKSAFITINTNFGSHNVQIFGTCSPFVEININPELARVALDSSDWGDYDNDGDLDLLLTGTLSDGPWQGLSKVYRNDANGVFTDILANLVGVDIGKCKWGDYDNDGDLDILLTGYIGSNTNISKVYRNDGDGVFVDIAAGLQSVIDGTGAVAWGDYDNDGDLDILLSGAISNFDRITRIYKNNGNDTFTAIDAGLQGVGSGSVAWGDYDNDGDLDILMTGSGLSNVYRNDGNGTFTEIADGLLGVTFSSAAWGDYDNDGYLDILLTGYIGLNGISKIYHNNGNSTFTAIDAGLQGVGNGSVSWGDYDNDGDLDILLTGNINSDEAISIIYRNEGNGNFNNIIAGLSEASGSASWGDYDNDKDLDIILTGSAGSYEHNPKIYRNDTVTLNSLPSAPTNLTTSVDGAYIDFRWNAASDNQTPTLGLSYNLRIGTTPGGNQIFSAMSDTSGYRLISTKGNVSSNCMWKIKTSALPTTASYYWSVQAIDGAYSGSSFASESILSYQSIRILSPNGGEYWHSGTTQTVYWAAVSAINQVNILLSINNGSNWITLNSSPVTASLGRFTFTLPSTISTQCLIKIVSSTDQNSYDLTDSSFSILNNASSSINLTAPTNSKLQVGKTYNINWSAIGITNIKLEYSIDAGQNWNTIVSTIAANVGTYEWVVPELQTTTCYLKVSDASNSAVYDWNNEPYTVTKLIVNAPNGNEIWSSGSTHAITWTSINIDNVKLEYSTDSGILWTQISASINASIRTLNWTLPDANSSQCKIRIKDVADTLINDVSDLPFTIRPKIIVTAPNGGDYLLVNSIYTITWSATVDEPSIVIYYSIDNGTNWLPVQTSPIIASEGSYDWIVPNHESATCLIKVVDSSSSSVYDVSDSVFTISSIVINNAPEAIPLVTKLSHNYPNPFSTNTSIQYSLKDSGKCKISIYNIKGQLVKVIRNENNKAGYYQVSWDGENENNERVTSGLYIVKMETQGKIYTKKIVLKN